MATATALNSKVYEEIRERVLNRELLPGETVDRRKIAEELGTSLAPVQQAISRLAAEGLLEIQPRRGTRVRVIQHEDVRGHLILREALECQAARMYCGEPIKEHHDELLPLARELDGREANLPEHWKTEVEFHRMLVEMTDCAVLLDEYDRVIQLGLFYAVNMLIPRGEIEQFSHVELLKELGEAAPDEAERLVRAHVRSGKGRLVE